MILHRRIRLPRIKIIACLPLLSIGCVTVPQSPSPIDSIETPASFVAASPQQTSDTNPTGALEAGLDQWWRRFGDPTLNQLVERGLKSNLDLQLAASRVESAAAQARIAGANLTPQVSIGLSSRRSKQNFIGFPIPGSENRVLSSTSTSHSLALTTSWEPDLWGRLRASERSAVLDARAIEYDLAAARTSLAAQLVKIYFNHSEAKQQITLDSKTLTSRQQTADRIDARYQRGLASPLEVRLARAQVAGVQASLATNRMRAETTTRQLEVLLGDYPGGRLFSEDKASVDLPRLDDPVPLGLPSELLLRRPDLRAAEQRALAAAQRVGQARGALYPSFSMTASGGSTSNDLSDLLNRDFSVWSLASNLLQPLFQGGRLRAAVDANQAVHRQALLQWIQLSLRAFSEVETQLAIERLTRLKLEALDSALEQTREAERLANDRYLAGLASYLDLLDSQRQASSAESQSITARRQLLDARVDLVLALGGGFSDSDALSESSEDGLEPTPPASSEHSS